MLATASGVADTTVDAALTAFETAAAALHDLNFEVLSNPERVTVLQRLETVARMIPSVQHTLIAQVQQQWVYRELGNGNLTWVLSDALRITPGDARTRTHLADELGPRKAITGQPLDPIYRETAAAQQKGHLGEDHIKVIREFFRHLPSDIDIDTREHAEAAWQLRPPSYDPTNCANSPTGCWPTSTPTAPSTTRKTAPAAAASTSANKAPTR